MKVVRKNSKDLSQILAVFSFLFSLLLGVCHAQWTSEDIGSVRAAGFYSYDSTTGVYSVTGNGSDIYGNTDAFQYVYQTIPNDGELIARVASVQNTDGWAKAGVMIRQSSDAGSIQATTVRTPGNGISSQYRDSFGGDTTQAVGYSNSGAPSWVKITKDGNLVTSYQSTDGTNWTPLGCVTLAFTGPVEIGLVVCSHTNDNTLCSATFDNVSLVSQLSFPPPAPWVDQDIGSVGITGQVHYDNNHWTISASGSDIYGSADAFHFAYEPLNGDGSIVAKVDTLSNTDYWAKAGLMIRQDLTPGSAEAMAAITPGGGIVSLTRPSPGADMTQVSGATVSAPYWLRLTRTGNQFTFSESANGVTWQQFNVQTIVMPQQVYIGLAESSHDDSNLAIGTFSNVQTMPSTLMDDNATDTFIDLIWPSLANPSSITNYEVDRNGVAVGTSTKTGFEDIQLSPSTTYNYQIKALGSSGQVLATSPTVAITTNAPWLPSPWTHLDIGLIHLGGSAAFDASTGIFTQMGSGARIWGTADSFQFAYQPLVGDGAIVARVNSITPTNDWAKGGIMLRATADPGSANVMITVLPDGNVVFQQRSSAGGSTSSIATAGVGAHWLKLTRQDNTITAYVSADGIYWSAMGSTTTSMGTALEAGLAVSSNDTTQPATAVFDNVSVVAGTPGQTPPTSPGTPTTVAVGDVSATIQWTAATDTFAVTGYTISRNGAVVAEAGTNLQFTDTGLIPGQSYSYSVRATNLGGLTSSSSGALNVTTTAKAVPWQWQHAEIGTVGVTGSASYTGGVFTISASGDDVWNSADAFGYAYQMLPGDGQITARVSSLSGGDSGWAKAGVMLRQSLAPGSPQTFMLVSEGNGLNYQSRDTEGDSSGTQGGNSGSAPVWVRLVRTGGVVTGYSSLDGVTWTYIAQQTFDLTATLYAGLAITSHQNDILATATFDNVSVQPVDNDGNGLPDYWQLQYFGELGNDPTSSPDGNGFTLLEDYLGGADPTNYYSQPSGDGEVLTTPTLTMTGGNNQSGAAGAFTSLPLTIKITNSNGGAALVNAPVTFTVTSGAGQIATTNTGTSLNSTVQLTTDSSGIAQIYYKQPSGAGVSSQINAISGGQSVSFSELTGSTTPIPQITNPPTVVLAVNASFSYAITASNSPTSYSAVGLPSGLSVNTTTGVISGTPTLAGVYNSYLTATNTTGTDTRFVVFEVVQTLATPVINSTNAIVGQAGSSITYQITASNNPTHFGASNLPSGLTINTSTGVISGTVTALGTYTINLSAGNGSGTGTQVLSLAINSATSGGSQQPSPVITSSSTASGTASQPFTYSTLATNSPTGYGAIGLPNGLSVNAATGVISGTPNNGGSYAVLISATNAGGTTSSLLNLTIAYSAPAITSSTAASSVAGTEFKYAITATNNPSSYSASNLPAGLTLNPTSGIISGLPPSVGTFTISLGATNSIGTGSATLSLTVTTQGPPVITTPTIIYATIGQAFAYAVTASNTPTVFGASGLPSGLTINTATGVISGTPTAVGTPNVTLSASNALGQGTSPLILVVQAATGSVTSTLNLQNGVSPGAVYQTTSFGIATDTRNLLTAGSPVGSLIVGAASTYTQSNRTLLGFDLSPVPTSATITSASLLLHGNSTSTLTVELHPTAAAFNPGNASWTNNSSYLSTLLSSLTIPATGGLETWPSSSDFVSAVQSVVSARGMLDLMLVSPSVESSGTMSYVTFSSENVTLPSARPALVLAYTTSAPPVIASVLQGLSVNAGTSYYYSIGALNNPASYSASGLPSGLSINSSTGVIAGTTTAVGSYPVTISATNANGTGSTSFTLNVVTPIPTSGPVFTSPSLAYATAGTAFNYTTMVANGPATFSATSLPSGLTINSTTGVISGTPTVGEIGTSNVTITATNSFGVTTAPLLLVIQSNSSTVTVALPLQDGVSPTADYQTASSGVANDTTNSSIANASGGPLLVGQMLSTQTNRGLLGFDLSVVPSGATITSTQLILNAEATGYSSSTTSCAVEIHAPTASLIQLSDLENVTWTNAAGYNPTVLSSLTTSVPTTITQETWPSSSAFVSATQSALNNGTPLFLLLVAPTLETSTAPSYFLFDNEAATYTPPAASTRPILLVTYTTSAPPVITSSATASGAPGTAFNYQVGSLNGATSYSASGLPAGLSINPTTGAITGTTSLSGTFTVTITASNANGSSNKTLTFTIGNIPAITSAITANAAVNSPFSYTITASNTTGASPVYSATNLPSGLTLNPSTGVISGTPLYVGYSATVGLSVTTTYGSSASTNLIITFAPVITSSSLTLAGNLNDSLKDFYIPTNNNPTSFSVSPANGLSSVGLSINSYGKITGTPTSATPSGGTQLTVTATNAAGSSSATLNLTIVPLPVPTIPSQNALAIMGVPFYWPASAIVSTAADSYPISPANYTATGLPGGLHIDSHSGQITGTPTDNVIVATPYVVTISASDPAGSASGTLNLTLYPPGPGIRSPLTASADVGTSFDYKLYTIAYDTTSTSATGLPEGLTFTNHGSYGQITGTPTTPGNYSVTLSATDSAGISTATLVLYVGSITSPANTTAQVGIPFNFTVTDSNTPTNFQAPNLPQGLTIDQTTGVISGIPVSAQAIPITLMVTDAGGTQSSILQLTINPKSGDSILAFQQGVSPITSYTTPFANIEYDVQNVATANQTFNTGTILTVGKATPTASSRALLGFDLSALPANAVITGVTLMMTTTANSFSGAALTVELHQSDAPLVASSATWNNDNGYNPAILDSLTLDPSSAAGSKTFPITPAFIQAVQQTYNHGLPLYLTLVSPGVESKSTTDYLGFVINGANPAQNPQLIVTYEVTAPSTPVITSASTAIGTVNASFSYAITASNNPTQFSATGLPSGLTLNTSTGIVSGTVNAVGSTIATVNATNSAGTGNEAVTFNIDSATPATNLQIISGNNQVGPPSTFLALPLIVQASYNGTALPNALVTFNVPIGEGAFALSATGTPIANAITAVTNGSGQATVYFFLPQSLRATTIVASAGTAQPISFVETSALSSSGNDSLVLLSVLSGEGQSGPAGQTLPQPFVVQASNAFSQPNSGQNLSLNVFQGGGGISTSTTGSFVGSLNVTTNALGQATVYLRPGTADPNGLNKASCSATVNGSTTSVNLTALTGSSSHTSPSPQGGTPPGTDSDPVGWGGFVQVMPTDNANPTHVTIHWSGNISNVTGYLLEKKVSTGQWFQLDQENGASNTTYQDSGLQANEEVYYRVTPYINTNLGSSSNPVSYTVPVLADLPFQTSSAYGSKAGYCEYTQRSVPPKLYLTKTEDSSYNEGGWVNGNSSGDQATYNNTVTLIPTPIPNPPWLDPNAPEGYLQNNWTYSGTSQGSSWSTSSLRAYTLNSTENAMGDWNGILTGTYDTGDSFSYSIDYPAIDLNFAYWTANQIHTTQTSMTGASYYSDYHSYYTKRGTSSLSNLYSTEQLKTNVNDSLPNYGIWQKNYYGWNWYHGAYWGWNDYAWLGWWTANKHLSADELSYNVSAARYKFTAYPTKDYHFRWAEILYADDPTGKLTEAQRTSVVNIKSWTINSSSKLDSQPYELNPTKNASGYGEYYIASVPQLYIPDLGSGSAYGASNLDSEEKSQIGAGVPYLPNPTSENIYHGFSFYVTKQRIPGATYTLSWTDNSFQVWGYNSFYDDWEQISNGQQMNYEYYDNDSDPVDVASYFTIVATSGTVSGDQITLTLSSKGPDGNSLGTDSSLFTYTAPQPDLSIPIDEASGSRYRKIALNGIPLSDEKPQQAAESDQEKEETYVDALTLGLRHSTTDVYMAVSGSNFALSARRDFRSQVWNDRHGLRPHEQPDLPFGICWSSNLAPSIKFTRNYDPSNLTQPNQAIVTDEAGAVHTFYLWYNNGVEQYFPMPTAQNEAQVPNLESLTVDTSVTPNSYTFKRKYGETLTYQMTTLSQGTNIDRLVGSTNGAAVFYQYARLIRAADRVGNILNYQFQAATDLIPVTITVANQPGIKLSIAQTPVATLLSNSSLSGSVITSIWDGNGNKTSYGYSAAPGDSSAVALTSVTAPDGSITHYSYNATTEGDLTPPIKTPPSSVWSYVDLASITDPLGNVYLFTYNLDHSKLNYMNNSAIPFSGNFVQSGSPRNIATVAMPDNTTSHPDVATFTNNSLVYLTTQNNVLTVAGPRKNQVTDATGFTRTYTYGMPDVIPLPSFPQQHGNISASKIVAFQSLTITYGTLGSESFQFDINAAMALSQITDFSGNVTSFNHETPANKWTAPASYTSPLVSGAVLNGYYDDPVSQTDALNHSKTFTYDPTTRIMTDTVDENGNHSHYDIDSLGRRTTEKISAPGGTLVRETDFTYGNSSYPGFMTQKSVKALGGSSDPSWTQALVTQFVPDANGRVYQEIVDPGGLNLVTSYTYDANGNKLTSTDPKHHTTWFNYDSRNRLVTVSYSDGGQKQMVYDARGNKRVEYDENGFATLYDYDSLNRLTRQIRDMNGNAAFNVGTQTLTGVDPATDLITVYSYDNVNDKLTTKAPTGGITQMQYDHLQRLTDLYTSPDNSLQYHTQFVYGANSGGNAFDSSSFKPTHTVDPRGFTTDIGYDALYRPVTKAVQYDASQAPSSTSTGYDNVGNATLVTDPLGHQTLIQYDSLNRPVLTTNSDNTTAQAFYTSTGFKFKTIDENGNATLTQYDNAGRPTVVTGALVDNGSGTQAAPVTRTYYDAAGNVAETVNPLGNKWDYVYDARNRKRQEFEPAVVDKDPASSTYNTYVQPLLTWQYDQGGRVTATVDARNNETDMLYDAANRVTDLNAPSVPFGTGTSRPNTHTTYDLDGNVLTLRDANLHTTINTYDFLNRLVTSTDAASIEVINSYDQVGNKLSVEDGNLHTTAFGYDGLNRNTTVTDAAGKVTTFIYDGLNKTGRQDPLGQATTYLYDVRNRLQYVVYASNAATNSQRQYAYDNNGNLLSVTEQSKTAANVAYGYDALNRVTSETSGGLKHIYKYDLAGSRLSTLYGAPGVTTPTSSTATRILTSTYDALNRLGTLQDQTPSEFATGPTSGRISTYGYDLNGNITQKTLPNGDHEVESFDALNRASSQTDTTGGGAALFTYAYGYDLVGNVLTVGETYPSGLNNRITTNTYDAINRLHIEAVTGSAPNLSTTYGYDSGNNRLTKAVTTGSTTVTTNYNYSNLNQLTSYSDTGDTRSVSLGYDLDGNRTSRTVTGGSDNGTDTYSYDFENRLIGLTKGTGGGAGTYAYTYDYRTRRIVRDESSAGGAVTDLIFSGGTSVQEYAGSVSSANLSVENLRGSDYGGGVGGILYTIRGGTPSYTHENKRGDVVAKTDGTGTLTYQAQYEAFGKQTATTGSTLDRQKSNSKDTDPTGLVDEGFRYRDLETGMFISRDPAGFVDGPNLYTYVVQNPWTGFDPEGLQDERIVGTEEDDIKETGAGLRNNDPELDEEGKPIFGSQAYERANPPPSQAPSGPTFGNGPGQIPPMNLGPSLLPPQEPPKTEDEIAWEVAKQMEAEKPKTPGPETQKQETDDNKEKTGSSTPPTPQKPPAKPGPKTDPTAPHNAEISAQGQALEGEGNTIIAGGGRTKERLVPTPGGNKEGRRPDIIYQTPSGETRGRNVGKVDANGNPVTREQKALNDLNGPGGLRTDFVPYNSKRS